MTSWLQKLSVNKVLKYGSLTHSVMEMKVTALVGFTGGGTLCLKSLSNSPPYKLEDT